MLNTVWESMAHILLPDPNALCLDHVTVEEGIIVFHGATTAQAAPCPACGYCSARIHSHYRRTLQDLPWQGNAVRFLLTVPEFFSDNKGSPRKIFARLIGLTLSPDAARYRFKRSACP